MHASSTHLGDAMKQQESNRHKFQTYATSFEMVVFFFCNPSYF
uniref:Uncharacterized protein n=1 Tax=Anguilla anguilla TaxID=7936 RepID=A0A0E9WSN6_ANGAN